MSKESEAASLLDPISQASSRIITTWSNRARNYWQHPNPYFLEILWNLFFAQMGNNLWTDQKQMWLSSYMFFQLGPVPQNHGGAMMFLLFVLLSAVHVATSRADTTCARRHNIVFIYICLSIDSNVRRGCTMWDRAARGRRGLQRGRGRRRKLFQSSRCLEGEDFFQARVWRIDNSEEE